MLRAAVYVHGFASSPRSSKARFFAERFQAHGIGLVTPDFNEPDFSTLTLTRMIRQLEGVLALLPGSIPVCLIGSSLGGLAAVLTVVGSLDAGRTPAERMILLAPALDFGRSRDRQLGPDGIERWRRTDRLDVYHFGYGEMRWVRYGLYEDAWRYDAFRSPIPVPTLVFQGTRDETVDPAVVERWARTQPNVVLHLVDDDHQMLASLDVIWRMSAEFLGL